VFCRVQATLWDQSASFGAVQANGSHRNVTSVLSCVSENRSSSDSILEPHQGIQHQHHHHHHQQQQQQQQQEEEEEEDEDEEEEEEEGHYHHSNCLPPFPTPLGFSPRSVGLPL